MQSIQKVKSNQSPRSFGAIVRHRREELNISMADLAEHCGIDQGNLSRIERGLRKPPELPDVLRIAEKLRITKDSDEFLDLMRKAEEERYWDRSRYPSLAPVEDWLESQDSETQVISCGTLGEMVSKVTEKAITANAVEITLKTPSGEVARFRNLNPQPTLLPPWDRLYELGSAGRFDDLAVYFVRETTGADVSELDSALRPFMPTRGEVTLLAAPNLVIWNRASEQFADLIVRLVRQKRLYAHPSQHGGPWPGLPLAKRPFQRNYVRPHWLPVGFYIQPTEGKRVLEVTKQ